MKALLPLFLVTFLVGCVSVKYSPQRVDSPLPDNVKVCGSKKLERYVILEKGESCAFPVIANQKLTLTPVMVKEGEIYQITVPTRNQVWYDKSRRNTPPKGESGSWIMNLFGGYKQHESLWFSLVVTNLNSDGETQQEVQDVSKVPVLKVEHQGQLAFYPNDAIIPPHGDNVWTNLLPLPRSDFYYLNNSGHIWVHIKHCAGACQSVVSESD